MVRRFFVVVLFVILDRALKLGVRFMEEPFMLVPGVAVVNVENTGALFGLASGNNLLFVLLSVIAFIAIVRFWGRLVATRFSSWMLCLVTAGLLGNLWDRLQYGFVVDFLAVGWWPAFNLADVCITLGVLGLVAEELYTSFSKKAS